MNISFHDMPRHSNNKHRKKLYYSIRPLVTGLDDYTLFTEEQKIVTRAILARLMFARRVIVADEPAIDKLMVAFTAAVVVHLCDPWERPVVIMCHESQKKSWVKSYGSFIKKYLSLVVREMVKGVPADSGGEFIDLINRSKQLKNGVIFSTRGVINAALLKQYRSKYDSHLPLIIMDKTPNHGNPDIEPGRGEDFLDCRYFHQIYERVIIIAENSSHILEDHVFAYLRRFYNTMGIEKLELFGMNEISYRKDIDKLLANLEAAQDACVRLDAAWQLLQPSILLSNDTTFQFEQIDQWLSSLKTTNILERMGPVAYECYNQACRAVDNVKSVLRRWVIQPSRYLAQLKTKE